MAIGLSVAETAIGVSTNVPIRSLPLDRPLLGMGFDFVGGCVEEARILPRIPRKNAYHKPDISTQTSWHTFHKSTRVGDQLEINRRGLQLRVLSELSVGGRIASFLIYRADLIIRRGVVFLRPYPGKDIGLRWAIGFDS
ncbi:MAG: hypothetical protein MK134_11110, partial [Dehalococcoidia bacterium]|nr:hypothetical protein [Dehalococcoidia bacterium]